MGFLSRALFGTPPRRLEHPVLGEALLMPAKLGSPYWEVETTVAGRPFSVAVETTGEQEPTAAQVEFFAFYANNPGHAFQRASSLLIPEYERWVSKPFPALWREAFMLTGMSIPIGAEETNPWDLSFECLQDRRGHSFTCMFLHGVPNAIEVDG